MQQAKQLEDVGGSIYLAELWEAAPTAANAEYYAKIVREKAIIRGLIHASTEILRDAYDQAQPAEELLGAAERRVLDIAEKGVTSNTYTLRKRPARCLHPHRPAGRPARSERHQRHRDRLH